MAKPSTLSKEYLSDSDADSDREEIPSFKVPKNYKKCSSLKKFPKKHSNEELWLIKLPKNLDPSNLDILPLDNGLISVKNSSKKYLLSKDLTQGASSNLILLKSNDDKQTLSTVNLNKNNNKEKKSNTNSLFDRVLTISEIADIPEINYDEVRKPRENVLKVDNLQMKHFATGYSAKDFGLDDEEQTSISSQKEDTKKERKSKKRSHKDDESKHKDSSHKKKQKDKSKKKD